MTVFQFCQKFNLKFLSQGEDKPISGGFCGDLLSWVMANAQTNHAWFTVMGNINAVAVASLNDVSCIILCQDANLSEDALNKAKEEKINVLSTSLSMFEISAILYNNLEA